MTSNATEIPDARALAKKLGVKIQLHQTLVIRDEKVWLVPKSNHMAGRCLHDVVIGPPLPDQPTCDKCGVSIVVGEPVTWTESHVYHRACSPFACEAIS